MDRGRSLLMALILAMPVTIGCYQARISNTDLWFLDVPPDVPEDQGTPDVPPTETVDAPAEATGDTPTDAPLPDTDRPTGSPCTEDGQCFAGTCLTTEFLQLLNPNLEAPGGMCSWLNCVDDAECGSGGKCADASPVATGFPMLCVKQCTVDADCGRAEYGCPNLGVVDQEGNPLQGCLPLKLVQLLVCDNGKCTNEPKDPYCPETCPQ